MKRALAGVLVVLLAVSLLGGLAAGSNLTTTPAGLVTIELIFSEAAFRNTLSVISPAVAIGQSGCKLEPATGLGGVHILSEKVSQRGCRVELDAAPATAGIQPFPAGTTFEFGFCAQTDADPACEFVWSSNPASNSDSFDHLLTTPIQNAAFPGRIFQLAWEDLPGGGDQDFNDLIAVLRIGTDADGDGLWDDWEQFGVDTNGDGTIDLDLPALGANPQRKNIFLEVDFMDCAVAGGDCAAGDTHSHQPKAAAVNAVVQAFANAPVANPDGSTGITLRLDVSNAIPHQNFLDIPAAGCGGSPLPAGIGNYDTVKADPANFGAASPRRVAYHYQLFIHRRGPATTSSGCAELPGNDAITALGEWNTACVGRGPNGVLDTTAGGDDVRVDGNTRTIYTGPNLVCNTAASGDDAQFVPLGNSPPGDRDGDGLEDRTIGTIQQQAGTLIHEFGHNLQLCHGGQLDPPTFTQCNMNFKPNYLSAMNYFFQFGIPPDPDGAGPLRGRVDYSAPALAPLNENNLNEPAGIGDGTDNTLYFCPGGAIATGAGTGGIDWNCDGDTTDTGIQVDINGNGAFDALLAGFNDWTSLKFDFQNTGDFEDGVHETATPVEIDRPTVLQIPEIVEIDIKPGSFPNSINKKSRGKIPVAILSSASFDAPGEVDVDETTLTFGRTGEESSLVKCNAEDVNGDGLPDLVCHFYTQAADFERGSTIGTLRGETVDGAPFIATDSVRIRG